MSIAVKPVFEPGWIAHRIVIERPTATAHGRGVIAFSPFATVWAAVEPVRAGKVDDDHLGASITHRVTIRWRDDVAAGMRIRHRGRMFAIETVADPDERRRFLVDRGEGGDVMGEVCPTCKSTDPNNCGLSWMDAGCDHPAVQRETKEMFRALMAGELIPADPRDARIADLEARLAETERQEAKPVAEGPTAWLIRKGGHYYRPNRSGYTAVKAEAGRYTEAEARDEAAIEPWHMSALLADDVPGPVSPPAPGCAEALEKAITAVEALRDPVEGPSWNGALDEAAAAIRALKEVG